MGLDWADRYRRDRISHFYYERRVNGRHWPVTVCLFGAAPLRRLTEPHRGEIENERLQQFAGLSTTARQHIDKVFLIRLSKRQPIDHALLSKLRKTRNVPPKGPFKNMPADLSAFEHPPRTEATRID